MASADTSVTASMLQFLDRWRGLGGPAASVDDIVDDEWSPTCLSYSMRDGAWRYDHVGETHNRMNGVGLSGRLEDALDQDYFAHVLEASAMMQGSGEPIYAESVCSVGRSAGLLGARVSAPVAPAPGAEATILTAFEWRDAPTDFCDKPLRLIVARFFGEAIADRLDDGRDLPLTAIVHLLRMISSSDFFPVSDEERRYVTSRIERLWTIRSMAGAAAGDV